MRWSKGICCYRINDLCLASALLEWDKYHVKCVHLRKYYMVYKSDVQLCHNTCTLLYMSSSWRRVRFSNFDTFCWWLLPDFRFFHWHGNLCRSLSHLVPWVPVQLELGFSPTYWFSGITWGPFYVTWSGQSDLIAPCIRVLFRRSCHIFFYFYKRKIWLGLCARGNSLEYNFV